MRDCAVLPLSRIRLNAFLRYCTSTRTIGASFGRSLAVQSPAQKGSVALLACLLFTPMLPQTVRAEPLPANKLVTSSLVSPAAAWSRFGSSATHTAGLAATTSTPADVLALARGLGAGRSDISASQYTNNVFDYIRNNIDTEFRFGLGKGGRGALIDQSGTPFDQAELMVLLLQQKSIAATYKVGTITLNAQQFGRWAGLVSNLNEASQSFTINALAACQLLADGGIPATVNGGNDCSGLSGNLSSVELGHIWVEVGGVWYDPGFKQNILKSGVDIATAAGCGNFSSSTCGTQVTSAAISGSASGVLGGSPWIQNVNKTALGSQLNSYAVNIENYVRANVPLGDIVDVVGGTKRDISYSPVPANGSLPYPANVQYSWVGEIPDQFRTSVRITFLDIDKTLFVDELSGRSLAYGGSSGSLTLDLQVLASTSCTYQSTNCGIFPTSSTLNYGSSSYTYNYSSAYLKIAFSHPYSSPSAEANRPFFQFIRSAVYNSYGPSFSIFARVGRASRSTEEFYGSLVGAVGLAGQSSQPAPIQDGSDAATFASVRADQDSAAAIISASEQVAFLRHNSVGIFETGQNFRTQSVASTASAQARDGDNQKRTAAFATVSMLDTILESRDPNYFSYSAASGGFSLDNAQNIKFISVAPNAFSALSSSLADYSAYDKGLLQAGSSEGYGLIIPQDGLAACTALLSNPSLPTYSGSACPISDGAPVFAYNDSASGLLIGARWKGNGEPVLPIPEIGKRDFSVKDKKFFGLDAAKAALNLAPSPDIVTGSGAFPMSLSFQRTYDSSSAWYERAAFNSSNGRFAIYYNGIEKQSLPEKIGGGWSHNYMMYADVKTSQSSMLGEVSGIDASAILSAIASLRGMHLANTFGARLASVFTADWILSKIANSSVSIKGRQGIESFVRLPSGAYNGRPGSGSSVMVTGTYGGPYVSFSSGPTYGYVGLNFTYRDADGSSYLFPARDQNSPATEASISSITGSTGVKVTFLRNGEGTANPSISVANSLGRSLLLQAHDDSGYGGALLPARLTSVTDDLGRVVSLQKEGCPTIGTYLTYTAIFVCNTFKVVFPDNSIVKYEYNPATDSPDPAVPIRSNYRLRRVYTAGNMNVPFRVITYDDLFRVAEIKDSLGHSTKLYPTSLARENIRTTAQLDGLGAESRARFNSSGAPLVTSDALGRQSTRVYDNAGRLLREIMPEGNAIEYSYDLRGNKLTECRIAKGRVTWSSLTPLTEQTAQCNSGAGDLVTTTGYMEGPSIRTDQCTNHKTCNRPSYVIDPKGNRTDYTWSATHGQMLTETKPADANGIRPLTTYGYTAFTGVDGATFYLLTSKQEAIDATSTSTTTWAYNGAAAKFTLREQVVDSGGLSLRTCFKFDAAGNLISKTEPQAGLASCS